MDQLMADFLQNSIENVFDELSLEAINQAKCDEILAAKLKDGRNVSVHKFSKDLEHAAFRIHLLHRRLVHPNLARVLCFASNSSGDLFVVYDLPYEGTLQELLSCVDRRDIITQLLSVMLFLQLKSIVVRTSHPGYMLVSTRHGNKPSLQLCFLGCARPVPREQVTMDLSCVPPELRNVSPFADSVFTAGALSNFVLTQERLQVSAPDDEDRWVTTSSSHKHLVQPESSVVPFRSSRLIDFEKVFLKSVATRMTAEPSKNRPTIAEVMSMLNKDT